jgi:hypothetical protein
MSPVAAKRWFGVDAPRRTVVTVSVPSTATKRAPINLDEVVRREIARAQGRIFL